MQESRWKKISLKVPADLHEWLRTGALSKGISLSDFVRWLLLGCREREDKDKEKDSG